MIIESIAASILVATASIVGVIFFGGKNYPVYIQKYIAPVAVGVFLSLVLFELIPETLEISPAYGGITVAVGFIAFYILSSFLHDRYHRREEEHCDRKGSATLILIGDAIHNLADGFILGGAFLIDPSLGFLVAFGLMLHEIPQEIIEFGILIRAGYSKTRAILLNLLSASSIILGTLLIIFVSEHAQEYVWILTGIAAGNLLFLAASDLLPRIHGNLKDHGGIWKSSFSIILGFVIMTGILTWTHDKFGHGHLEHDEHEEELHEEDSEIHLDDLLHQDEIDFDHS